VEKGGISTCTRCALVESFKQWVEELQKEIIRLHCVREKEPQIGNYLRLQKKKWQSPTALTSKGCQTDGVNSKQTTPWRKRTHDL